METDLKKQWDLDAIYEGGKQSEQLNHHISRVNNRTEVLSNHIKDLSSMTSMFDIIDDVQQVLEEAFHIDEFCICLASEDTSDQEAAKLMDQSNQLKMKVDTLRNELEQVFKSLNELEWNELLNKEESVAIHPYLHKQKQQKDHQLSPQVEEAINQLSLNGFIGWENHFEQLFSQLRVPVSIDGEVKQLTFNEAMIRAMLNPDRDVRKETADATQEVCKQNKDTFASILNHFAGYRLSIYQLRELSDMQGELYEKNKISKKALTSMMAAIEKNQTKVQAFLKRKAQLMGLSKLSYFDNHTSVFSSKSSLSYEEAATIIKQQFHSFSDSMGRIADQAFDQHWIDAEPRKNKAFGAFCASMPLNNESRILLTFEEKYHDVITIAHELGHAYHNSILQKQPAFAQETGTGLAETASTFAENLVLDSAKNQAGTEEDELSLLEMQINSGIKYITMIPSKFDFEKKFYERRMKEKLTGDELAHLMEETEKKWSQDSFAEYDAYSWMTIPHFYDTENAFYNIPYTIGYLFSNGIYALSLTKGSEFGQNYDELLKHSGSLSMEELGKKYLDQDLTSEAFWNQSMQPLMTAIDEFLQKTESMV
ncbi:M3 family oligoendopeptidase [Halobacillus locisalis]|uniref:M3 family oligoendopeptidase n=1 Tax=Halobacillus locisalis TaxID=220753 RepID=A0A838CQ37_9BACI|nr:M3 family oligoendopeptidase [Halobacillus locisalis]MBA2174232.1 M3 family oligoendopeptidase [Halobacillus locisalis]